MEMPSYEDAVFCDGEEITQGGEWHEAELHVTEAKPG